MTLSCSANRVRNSSLAFACSFNLPSNRSNRSVVVSPPSVEVEGLVTRTRVWCSPCNQSGSATRCSSHGFSSSSRRLHEMHTRTSERVSGSQPSLSYASHAHTCAHYAAPIRLVGYTVSAHSAPRFVIEVGHILGPSKIIGMFHLERRTP